jgi:EAL domain-containing protein (putative c-di-GMP-specific phosphodiesterase class I)
MTTTSEPQRLPLRGITLDASVWFFAGRTDETDAVRHVPIHTLPFRIGRRPDLCLTLPSNCVSKEHAEIFANDGQLWVRDLGSTNGTYVNGARVEADMPIKEGDLIQFATMVFRVGQEANTREGCTTTEDACDRALVMIQFERLMSSGSVVPFFQPIVQLQGREPIGYEILGRSQLFGLRTPGEMFKAASELNMEAKLSRMFRNIGIQVAEAFAPNQLFFVNTHPIELKEDGLVESLRSLRTDHPTQKIVLEIHEAMVVNLKEILTLREVLRELDIQLAFDDFGAGQSRFIELSEAQPDFIKFDMKLIQDIHLAPLAKQQLVAALAKMVNDLGIQSLAEGVETEDCHQTLTQMGFHLGQGYLYGHPSPVNRYRPKPNLASS